MAHILAIAHRDHGRERAGNTGRPPFDRRVRYRARGKTTSSFAATGGNCHDLAGTNASTLFGFDEMARNLEKSIHTRPVGDKFVGDVVLTPEAVIDFMNWFLGQLCDGMRSSPAARSIATPWARRWDRTCSRCAAASTRPAPAPWQAMHSWRTPSRSSTRGRSRTLTPGLYRSLKTRLPHVPIASEGWEPLPATLRARSWYRARSAARSWGASRWATRGQRRLRRRDQEQLHDRRRQGGACALGDDDLGQRRADAEGRHGGQP